MSKTEANIRKHLESGRDRSFMSKVITCELCGQQLKAGGMGSHIRAHKLTRGQENEVLKTRLYENVFYSPDGCWYWTGAINGTMGYGVLRSKITNESATHRLSYILSKGEIPDGKWVLHYCDNPRCINPNHLFLGDRLSNVEDMHKKGRAKVICRGENHIDAKLTAEQVKSIKQRMANGETRANLAKEFGVNWICMHYIYIGKNWKHI